MQEGQTVTHYGKQSNNAQHNNSTVDNKCLSIVLTLHEFWSMLLGAELHVIQITKTSYTLETSHSADFAGFLTWMNMVMNYIM
jgi:hypothetical protein